MKTLVVLQNAWSPMYAGDTWPRESWLKALHRSRSGQRLARIWNPDDDNVWFDNTTPMVSEQSSGKLPVDPEHIRKTLRSVKPGLVVACGGQASDALQEHWSGKLLCMPHPANRLLTNLHIDQIKERILLADFRRTRCQTLDKWTLHWKDLP